MRLISHKLLLPLLAAMLFQPVSPARSQSGIRDGAGSRAGAPAIEHSARAAGDSEKPRGYLGLSVDLVPPAVRAQIVLKEGFGLSVVFVVPGGPADHAGLQIHDILTAFEQQPLTAVSRNLGLLASGRSPGERITLAILRKGSPLEIPVVLGDLRDAPVSLAPMQRAADAPIVDSLLEWFRRESEAGSASSSATGAGKAQLPVLDAAISGLLSDLRNQRREDGIRLETLDVRQSTVITTEKVEIFITSAGRESIPWISAHDHEGKLVYAGPLGEHTPPHVRRIIKETRGTHQSTVYP